MQRQRMPDETYVLLPGAGGEAWYWHLVVPRLEARGVEVLAVDLPAGDDDAGLAAYADAAVAAIGGRAGVVVVAQSLAAFTAPLLCDRVDVRRMILVAPMIPAPGETPGGWWASSGQEQAWREHEAAAGRDPDAGFDVVEGFFHDVPEAVVAAAFARGEPRQSGTPFGDPWPLATWPDVHTSVIAGRHDRLFPLPFMQRLARDRLGVEPDVIDSGHLPAFSRPDELAERLEAHRLEPARGAPR
jgi:hypothetical protein